MGLGEMGGHRPLGKNGWVSWCQENSYSCSPEWLEKSGRTSSHLLAGHNEERPIMPPLQFGRCHQADHGQATLEVIGGSWIMRWNCASQTMMMLLQVLKALSDCSVWCNAYCVICRHVLQHHLLKFLLQCFLHNLSIRSATSSLEVSDAFFVV